MKKLLASVFVLVLPLALLAQTPAKVGGKTKRPSASRVEIKSTASQMASGIQAAEAALTPAELAIAQRVYQGKLPCELGAFVTLTPDVKSPGYFDVLLKSQKFRMFPVETSTGAIRLEDHQAGAVWLQLANKSMLMSQKLGQRLADECKNPDQAVVAEMLIKNPAPSILDAPIAVAALATIAAPTAVVEVPAAMATPTAVVEMPAAMAAPTAVVEMPAAIAAPTAIAAPPTIVDPAPQLLLNK